MKKSTKNVWKVLISILYIIWGILSPVAAFEALVDLDPMALAKAGVDVLMLLAGIFALAGIKKSKCKLFGVIIMVCNIATAVASFGLRDILAVILSILFVICV